MKSVCVRLFAASFLLAVSAVQAQAVVEYVTPELATVGQELALTGTVTTARDAALSTQLQGLVADVQVDAGDRVESGQTLLTLDATLAALSLQREAAALEEARTRLAEARRLRDEAQPLAERGSLPQSEYATRRAEADLAAAALARLKAQHAEQAEIVARHQVRAPFDGVIRRRLVAPGEWVTPGQAVLELVALDDLRVDVQVPQQRYRELQATQAASVLIDALPGQSLSGRIDARVEALDAQARSFLVRVAIDASPDTVVPGMSARVRFALPGAEQAVVIPRDALLRFPDGSSMVWVLDEKSSVRRQPVTLGAQRGERVVVLEGLTADDRVIVRGNETLRSGQAVQARAFAP